MTRELTESELCAAGDICFEQDHAEPHPCPSCRADIVALVDAPHAAPHGTTETRDEDTALCHYCNLPAVLVTERKTMQWGGGRGELPFFHEADDEHWRCEKCGEEWYTPRQCRKLDSQLLHALTAEWRKLAALQGTPQTEWRELFARLALELGCLASSFPDGNGHVFAKVAALTATPQTETRDTEIVDALEARTLTIEAMGTTVEYWNVYGPKTFVTTAGKYNAGKSLRDLCHIALDAAMLRPDAPEGET